jgi:hypothetical protein
MILATSKKMILKSTQTVLTKNTVDIINRVFVKTYSVLNRSPFIVKIAINDIDKNIICIKIIKRFAGSNVPSLSFLNSLCNKTSQQSLVVALFQALTISRKITAIEINKTIILQSVTNKNNQIAISVDNYKSSKEISKLYTYLKNISIQERAYPKNLIQEGSIVKGVFSYLFDNDIPVIDHTKVLIIGRLYPIAKITRAIISEVAFQIFDDKYQQTQDRTYKLLEDIIQIQNPLGVTGVDFISEFSLGAKFCIYNIKNMSKTQIKTMTLLHKLPLQSQEAYLSKNFTGQSCCDAKLLFTEKNNDEVIDVYMDFKQKVLSISDVEQMYLKPFFSCNENIFLNILLEQNVKAKYLDFAFMSLQKRAEKLDDEYMLNRLMGINSLTNIDEKLVRLNELIIIKSKNNCFDYKTSIYFEVNIDVNMQKYNNINKNFSENIYQIANPKLFDDSKGFNKNFNIGIQGIFNDPNCIPKTDFQRRLFNDAYSESMENWKILKTNSSTFTPDFVQKTDIIP